MGNAAVDVNVKIGTEIHFLALLRRIGEGV